MQNFQVLKIPEGIKWYKTKNKKIVNWMFVFVFSSYQYLKLSFADSTMNLQIVLNAKTNPYLNQATTGIENFKPRKILWSFLLGLTGLNFIKVDQN